MRKMPIIFFLSLIAFAVVSMAVIAIRHICRRNRIQRAREEMYQAYLREQAVLEQQFFSTYFAMLREAQRHKGN